MNYLVYIACFNVIWMGLQLAHGEPIFSGDEFVHIKVHVPPEVHHHKIIHHYHKRRRPAKKGAPEKPQTSSKHPDDVLESLLLAEGKKHIHLDEDEASPHGDDHDRAPVETYVVKHEPKRPKSHVKTLKIIEEKEPDFGQHFLRDDEDEDIGGGGGYSYGKKSRTRTESIKVIDSKPPPPSFHHPHHHSLRLQDFGSDSHSEAAKVIESKRPAFQSNHHEHHHHSFQDDDYEAKSHTETYKIIDSKKRPHATDDDSQDGYRYVPSHVHVIEKKPPIHLYTESTNDHYLQPPVDDFKAQSHSHSLGSNGDGGGYTRYTDHHSPLGSSSSKTVDEGAGGYRYTRPAKPSSSSSTHNYIYEHRLKNSRVPNEADYSRNEDIGAGGYHGSEAGAGTDGYGHNEIVYNHNEDLHSYRPESTSNYPSHPQYSAEESHGRQQDARSQDSYLSAHRDYSGESGEKYRSYLPPTAYLPPSGSDQTIGASRSTSQRGVIDWPGAGGDEGRFSVTETYSGGDSYSATHVQGVGSGGYRYA